MKFHASDMMLYLQEKSLKNSKWRLVSPSFTKNIYNSNSPETSNVSTTRLPQKGTGTEWTGTTPPSEDHSKPAD